MSILSQPVVSALFVLPGDDYFASARGFHVQRILLPSFSCACDVPSFSLTDKTLTLI